mmetsp:Transcript_3387/g.3784  ORF Transcript_3387/g.3784 Transcript_3387/m.3784 type:complete len:926 (-) Transcript_3387:584-3361(-)
MGWLDNWKAGDDANLNLPEGHVPLINTTILYSTENTRHKKYAEILSQEVYKRSRCEWNSATSEKSNSQSEVLLKYNPGLESQVGLEGYVIETKSENGNEICITISAASDRGVLFGVGRLLREMTLDFEVSYSRELEKLCSLPKHLDLIVSRPQYKMRQHQVAYRPKTNSYDAFTPEMMHQEILDLVLFGTNAIEIIPPGVDDAMQSPNFSIPWLDMLTSVSSYCDSLDINVSMWYPAFFKKYDTPELLSVAQEHWDLIFSHLPRLDVLFVPGGDPGGRPAAELFEVVEVQAKYMREKYFPDAEVWVSSQYGLSVSVDLGLDEPWVPLVQEQQWMQELRTERVQSFLTGVVYGPWSCVPIHEFRAQIPEVLPLRNYPDLCHVQTAELPVTRWDLSFALTNNRESINPRPIEMLKIFQDQAPYTIGCGCYSEGVNDDINKYVWTALHWGDDVEGPLKNAAPNDVLNSLLTQYVKFLADQQRRHKELVECIYMLEQNWNGNLLENPSIVKLQQVTTAIENHLTPRHRKNWRLNMLLFRSYYDLLLYTRLVQSYNATNNAIEFVLENVSNGIIDSKMWEKAKDFIEIPYSEPAMSISSFESPSTLSAINVTQLSSKATVTHLYAKVNALAAVLYHQIGYQLSIGYGSQHRQRGAYFDLVWAPLGDVIYLNRIFTALQLPPLDRRVIDKVLVERFLTTVLEHIGESKQKVLWYASFGDSEASDLPGRLTKPTQPIPVSRVIAPYREYELGEDAVVYDRCLTEFLDCSNDEIYRDLHNGKIPRCWRSQLTSIWPRTAKHHMQFEVSKLLPDVKNMDDLNGDEICVRLTYLGDDLNKHGGDWEELNRKGMPTRMIANGCQVHSYLDPPEISRMQTYSLPYPAIRNAIESGMLILEWEPILREKVTYISVPLPIAELWILRSPSKGDSTKSKL